MKITIIEKTGDVCVWASLDESEPPASNECFVIGAGESKDAAIRDALETLDAAGKELERMTGSKTDRLADAAREETARGRAARRQP